MFIIPKKIKIQKFIFKPNIRKYIAEATEMLKFAEFDKIEEKYNNQLKELLSYK